MFDRPPPHVSACSPPMPARSEADGAYEALYDGVVHVPLKRSYDEASQWCRSCLNGRLAVLDSCEKNQATSRAVTPAITSGVATVLSKVARHASFPGSYAVSSLLDSSGQMLSSAPWIGMRSVATPGLRYLGGEHAMRWDCGDALCEEGGDPLQWMTPGARTDTVRQINDDPQGGRCWGWNSGTTKCGMQTTLTGAWDEWASGGTPHLRDEPSYGIFRHYFWDNIDQDNPRKRTFLCEFDMERALTAEGGEVCAAAD